MTNISEQRPVQTSFRSGIPLKEEKENTAWPHAISRVHSAYLYISAPKITRTQTHISERVGRKYRLCLRSARARATPYLHRRLCPPCQPLILRNPLYVHLLIEPIYYLILPEKQLKKKRENLHPHRVHHHHRKKSSGNLLLTYYLSLSKILLQHDNYTYILEAQGARG